jgi:hypothetical protein
MKPTITQVAYGRTINVGNYESVRIDLTARVTEDEEWQQVLAALKEKMRKLAAKEGA